MGGACSAYEGGESHVQGFGGNSLTSWGTVSFSRKTVLNGVSGKIGLFRCLGATFFLHLQNDVFRRFKRTYCIYLPLKTVHPYIARNVSLVLLWLVNQDGEYLKSGSCQDCPLFTRWWCHHKDKVRALRSNAILRYALLMLWQEGVLPQPVCTSLFCVYAFHGKNT
jgi:hypothetical protein